MPNVDYCQIPNTQFIHWGCYFLPINQMKPLSTSFRPTRSTLSSNQPNDTFYSPLFHLTSTSSIFPICYCLACRIGRYNMLVFYIRWISESYFLSLGQIMHISSTQPLLHLSDDSIKKIIAKKSSDM